MPLFKKPKEKAERKYRHARRAQHDLRYGAKSHDPFPAHSALFHVEFKKFVTGFFDLGMRRYQ